MVMDGLLVIRFERNLKNPEPVVLEQDLVVGRGGNYSVQCWIPSRWIETPWWSAMAFSLVGSQAWSPMLV